LGLINDAGQRVSMKKNSKGSKYQQNNTPALTASPKPNGLLIPFIIAFCVPVLLYLQTLGFGFTYFDDDGIIIKNISFLSDLGNARKAFLTDAFVIKMSSFYRPLQTLSLMTDIKLAGGNHAWMYHLTNILILGLISCTLFLLLKRFFIPPTIALLGALIYCTHPLFVSTVAWIPARGDLLLLLFSLLPFLCLMDYLRNGKIKYLITHLVAFTVALYCKETAAFLPLIFIAYYFTFTTTKPFNKKYLLIILLYIACGIVWFWLRFNAVGDYSNPNEVYGLAAILPNLRVIPEALAKVFLPFSFAPIPCFSLFNAIVGLGLIGIIIILFIRNNERTKKEKIFCLAWFLILMAPPMLYKHPYIDYMDHRFFLPMIGILIFVLFLIPKTWIEKGKVNSYWLPLALIVLLSSFTFIKSRDYSDPITFYNSAISHNPNSAIAYYNRGYVKSNKSDYQGACEDFSKAIAISPKFIEAYNNRGLAESSLGDNKAAIDDYTKAIVICPTYDMAYYNRGCEKNTMGDFSEAIADFDKALGLRPAYAEAYNNKGVSLYSMHNFQDAVTCFDKALAIRPDYAEAYNNKGLVKASLGDNKGAAEDYTKAIEMNPAYDLAYYNRGSVKNNEGDFRGAMDDFDKAIAIHPDYAQAYNNKGVSLYSIHNFKDAISCLDKAIEINPNYADAYFNRAVTKYYLKDIAGTLEDCEKVLRLNPNDKRASRLKAKVQQNIQKGNSQIK